MFFAGDRCIQSPMRLITVTVAALIASFIAFITIKFWGQSQVYPVYNNPLLKTTQEFEVYRLPQFEHVTEALMSSTDHLYLNITNTLDQKVVITPGKDVLKYDVRSRLYQDIANDVLLLLKFKDQLQKRNIIFNIVENPIAGHEIFVDELKALNLLNSDRVIVTSPYDVMTKSIKDIAPTLIFGTSQPEILRIKAMESLYLIEAATFRADIVMYPLKYYKHTFFTDELIKELQRRHKQWMIGPIEKSELDFAKALKPLAIILKD